MPLAFEGVRVTVDEPPSVRVRLAGAAAKDRAAFAVTETVTDAALLRESVAVMVTE